MPIGLFVWQVPALALSEQALTIKALAERTVSSLPGGVLYWHIENFGWVNQAKAVAGRWSLVVGSARLGANQAMKVSSSGSMDLRA